MSFENIPIIKNNIDYDDLLNKMNLVYQNGQLYRASQNIAQDKHSVETVNTNLKNIDKRGIYNKYFNTVEVEKPKTREEYIAMINEQRKEKYKSMLRQIQNRKLILPGNSEYIKSNLKADNTFFKLKLNR